MYEKSSASTGVDEARLEHFARKLGAYASIPPTRVTLKEHAKCVAYQARIIRGQALTQRSTVQPTKDELSQESHGRYIGQLFHLLQQAVRS